LEPTLPPDCPDLNAVFFFSSRETMEDGLLNWLDDRFPDPEKIVTLEVDLAGLDVVARCEWEWLVGTTGAPDCLRRVWEI